MRTQALLSFTFLFILSKKQLSSASLLSPKSASTRDTLLTPKHPGKSDSSTQRSSSPWSLVLGPLHLVAILVSQQSKGGQNAPVMCHQSMIPRLKQC